MEKKQHPTTPGKRGPETRDDRNDGALPAGTQIRHYKVTGPLRHSATGPVYLALDLSSGERVVLKRSAADAEAANGGPTEARIAARFRHPNAVRFIEALEDPTGRYLVFEYVEGMDLETFLDKAGAGIGEAALCDILLPVADCLEALHRAGFVHRDLKPGNLRIRDSGAPVLLDFGAATPLQKDAAEKDEWSALTDGYAAPELYSSDEAEGPWSDVYGLSAIAYRAITGAPPPPAPARLAGRPMPPAAEAGEGRYSTAFLEAIDSGLALEAAARPASAERWAEALAGRQSDDGDRPLRDPPAGAAEPPPHAHKADIGRADPYPPTLEVRRRPMGELRRPREAEPAGGGAADAAGRAWGRWIAVLLFLGAAAAAGYWVAWPYYLHNVKEVWIVDPGGKGDTTSISAALAAAKDGAIVKVAPGTYVESLTIDRPVQLLSSDPSGAAAVVAPESGPCLVVTAASGRIAGLTFQGAAPPVGSTPGLTPVCIDIAGGGVRLERLAVSNPSGIGVRLQGGAAASLEEISVADSGGHGVVFTEGARGRLAGSTIAHSGAVGIAVLEGAAPDIDGNNIDGSGAAGVLFASGAAGRFSDNSVTASAFSGIEIAGASAPEIAGNKIVNAGQAGIYLRAAGPTAIAGNEIAGSGFSGILVASAAGAEIRNNTVEDSGEFGILLLKGSRARLAENNLRHNDGNGIGIEKGAEAELTDNLAEGNKDPQIQRDGEARARPPAKPAE